MNYMRRCLQVLIVLTGIAPSFGQLPPDHAKVLRTDEILRRVGTVFGFNEGRTPPRLVMFSKQSSKRIAYLGPLNRLVLDERLYDVCEQIDGGSGAALAFVIAHELAHLHHGHRAHLSFAEVANTEVSNRLVKPRQEATRQEAEADQTGLLYAYMAGFDPQPVLEKLFDSLYVAYELKDDLPGYPSKSARKSQSQLQAETLRSIAMLFWVGQTLYCRGYVAQAAQCYQKILNWNPRREQHYLFREVFNNLGVCRLKQAFGASPDHPMRYFAMPFELDPQNRLLLLDKRGPSKPSPLVDEWLRQADEDFGQAVALDHTYTMAHLNRATCSLLRQNYHKAKGYLQDIQEYTLESSLPATWWLVNSLADYGLKETKQARQSMNNAKTKSASQTKNKIAQQKAQLIAYNWRTLESLLKNPSLPPKLPRFESTGCQAIPIALIDVKPPESATFSQLLVSETAPDPYLKVSLATVQSQPYIKVILTDREFVLTNLSVSAKR